MRQDPKGWIHDIKFDGEGLVLAAASEDGNIYLYDPLQNFSFRHCLPKHASPVHRIDFSFDGSLLMSQDSLNQVILWNLADHDSVDIGGEKLIAATQWSTRTCLVGWDTLGVLASDSPGVETTAVYRSRDRNVLVSGDSEGVVKVQRARYHIFLNA